MSTEEKVFLNEPYASVTSSRIVIAGATYATRNVGSVRLETIGRPSWPFVLIAMAVFPLVKGAYDWALIIALVGGVFAYVKGPKAKLHLMAGGGELLAIEDSNFQMVQTIHQAVVEAISTR
jgi:hypothetical protein